MDFDMQFVFESCWKFLRRLLSFVMAMISAEIGRAYEKWNAKSLHRATFLFVNALEH
jgi:hypothetical protein